MKYNIKSLSLSLSLSLSPVVHTSGGNSDGAPCDFPFLANGSWHHGCLSEADAPENFWCSTNSNYDQDHKFGRCLLPGMWWCFFMVFYVYSFVICQGRNHRDEFNCSYFGTTRPIQIV